MKTRAGLAMIPLLSALAAGFAVFPSPADGRYAWASAEWADVSLETPTGETVSLRDYVGKKAVLLAFWATWCPNCNAAVPRLNGIETGPLRDKVKLLAVDYLESPAKVDSFVRKRQVAYSVLLDRDGRVARHFGILGIPTYLLVDRNGRIVWKGNTLPVDLDRLLP